MTNPCALETLCRFQSSAGYPACQYLQRQYQDLTSCTLVGSFTYGNAPGVNPYSLNLDQLSFGVYYNSFLNNVALSVETQVSILGVNHQQNPSLATFENGDVLIVWESSGSLTYSKSCSGSVQYMPCSQTLYSTKTATDTFTASTIAQDGSGFGIFARSFSAFGNYGPDVPVNSFVTGDQRFPAVAAFHDSGSVIVWQSLAQDSSGWGIFGQRVTSTGLKVGNEFPVNTYVIGHQLSPAVATCVSRFVVVWQSAAQDGSGYGIYGRLFDSSANPGSEFRVNTYTLDDQLNPTVAAFTTGEFIVVWQSASQDGSGYGIYGQRFSAEGLSFGTEFSLNTYATGNQANPSIASFMDGGFVATWDSDSQDGSGKAVVARLYQNNELPSLKVGQLPIAEGGSVTITPFIFNVTGDHPLTQLMLTISNLQHGQFQINGTSVLQFSQQNIFNGQVQFIHDGAESPPDFLVTVSDGFFTLNAVAPNISFLPVNDPPSIIVNKLNTTQCQTIYFNANNLQAIDPDSPVESLTFWIVGLQFGTFKSTSLGNISVGHFSQSNITSGDIFFQHDCSAIDPEYQVTVDDGEFFVGPQTALVDFDGLTLVNNYLSIAEGQSVTLTLSNFNGAADAAPTNQILFIASDVRHGQFERIAFPGVVVSSFYLQEVQFGAIRFLHDGSEFAPSFNMSISDGVTILHPRAAIILYLPINDSPILIHNELAVTEGGSLILNSSHLSATDPDNLAADLIFLVTNLQDGRFGSIRHSDAVTTFLQQNISNGDIYFNHSGQGAPRYSITVSDGQRFSIPQEGTILFIAVNDAPVLINNGLTISQRGSVTLSSNDLSARDEETAADDLVFVVENVVHGQFEYVTAPGKGITKFSQSKIRTADMIFVHDGGLFKPAYTVRAIDPCGLQSEPKAANVLFILLPQAAEQQDWTRVYNSLSGLGGSGLAVLAYVWLRKRIAQHRRDFPFANDLRKVLNLEYYDFSRFDGDTFKTKIDHFLERLQLENQQFYTNLAPKEQKCFAICVAEVLIARNLVFPSNYGGGLFGVLCCINVGWPSQLNMKAFEAQSVEIAIEVMAAWKYYTGYQLRPMSDLNQDKEKGTIYVEIRDNTIQYVVIDPGVKQGGEEGAIKAEELGLTALPANVGGLQLYLSKILEITVRRGHTQPDKAKKRWQYHSPTLKEKVKVFCCCARPWTAGMVAPQRRFIELEELKKREMP